MSRESSSMLFLDGVVTKRYLNDVAQADDGAIVGNPMVRVTYDVVSPTNPTVEFKKMRPRNQCFDITSIRGTAAGVGSPCLVVVNLRTGEAGFWNLVEEFKTKACATTPLSLSPPTTTVLSRQTLDALGGGL